MLRLVRESPVAARAFPFFCFVLLTSFQGSLGGLSQYWLYALKTGLGAWLVWLVRDRVPEMRWSVSLPAILAGVGVFALWVGLDGFYPSLTSIVGKGAAAAEPSPWNPFRDFGPGTPAAWACIGVRWVGAAIVVPPIEEMFYRSFFYRSVERADFLSMPLTAFAPRGFFITALVFGLVHPREWIPGVLCGMVFQGLVLRRGHLGDAMTAHGITNLLLGLWVVYKQAWHFW